MSSSLVANRGGMDLSIDNEIGNRIRLKRLESRLSLRALAERAGLTASFLSQLERGRVNVSLGSLRRIAEGLGVPLLHFLEDSQVPAPPDTSPLQYSPVVLAAHRRTLTLPDSNVTYEMLVPDLSGKMEAFLGRVGPDTGNVARRLREQTEEFIHVLSGSLKVRLVTGEYLLNPGDSIYIEGSSLLELACASDDGVSWISVITPPVF